MPSDAEALLAAARRPLALGIGGGGDVVGALATAEAGRPDHGAGPLVGGVTWERRPIDPAPGPRRAEEIEGARQLNQTVLLAGPDTRVAGSGVLFAESRMAGFLGEDTVLVDPNPGPHAVAEGLAGLDADLIVFIDVGGDALAHGDEPGLASPLCDAVMIAAAALLASTPGAQPVLGGVFGTGCDGELRPREVVERFVEVGAAGGFAGALGLTGPVVERLAAAVQAVPTEASAQALRAFEGERGTTTIRQGRRTVELTGLAAATFYFDIPAAVGSAARLAAAVLEAADLEDANERLHQLGVRTELDLERDAV